MMGKKLTVNDVMSSSSFVFFLFLLGVVAGFLLGCAPAYVEVPVAGVAGTSCTVSQEPAGALITCSDGTSTLVPNGSPGESIVGPTGPQGEVGLAGQSITGPAGADGADGQDGADGTNGADGQDGSDGQDASPTTVVQFCPAQGATTYGHFPEKGLCIANKLYGVYYDGHNAFLAEIVAGNYTSTSTGLACSFTVVGGCVIQ